jgi:hypothetical protein
MPRPQPIRRNVPIIAGSAVGRKADSRQAVKARGQFQTFDTQRGWVENQARCARACVCAAAACSACSACLAGGCPGGLPQ